MQNFSEYLQIWNEWVVLPALIIGAFLFHRSRKLKSTKLILLGLLLFFIGKVLTTFFKLQILNPAYYFGLATGTAGLFIALLGCFKFWRHWHVQTNKNT